jgi:voltage-gated potassium channel
MTGLGRLNRFVPDPAYSTKWDPNALDEGVDMPDETEKLTNFDLFILALTLFSTINILWLIAPLNEQLTNVVLIVDVIYSFFFMTDFFLRLYRAPTKSAYFVGDRGWIDFLGSLPLPYIRILRIVRVIREYRPVQRLGPGGVWKRLKGDLAGSALLVAVFLTIIVLQYASMAILWVEGNNAEANIHTASDAVWWSYVTVTTVGYGDKFPVTNYGRLVGVALLSIGVGLFGVITGFLANTFLAPKRASSEAAQQVAWNEKLRELDDLLGTLRIAAAVQAPAADSGPSSTDRPST